MGRRPGPTDHRDTSIEAHSGWPRKLAPASRRPLKSSVQLYLELTLSLKQRVFTAEKNNCLKSKFQKL